MPKPRWPKLITHCAMFTDVSTCLDIFPELWATSLRLTSLIQCRSACLTTSRGRLSPSWRRSNGTTPTIESWYPCLLTRTAHEEISSTKKFLNGMGRRKRR
jgi:hypothetical protein